MERQAVRFSMSGRPRGLTLSILVAASCLALPLCLTSTPSYALSEIQREDLPSPVTPPANGDGATPGATVPMPEAPGTKPSGQPADDTDKSEPKTPPANGGITSPRADPDAP